MNNQLHQSPQQPVRYSLQASPTFAQVESLPSQALPVQSAAHMGLVQPQQSPSDMLQRQLASQMNGFHIQTPLTEYAPTFAPVQEAPQHIQQSVQSHPPFHQSDQTVQQPVQFLPEDGLYLPQVQQIQQMPNHHMQQPVNHQIPHQQVGLQHVQLQLLPQVNLHLQGMHSRIPPGQANGIPLGGPPNFADQQNPITPPQYQQSPRSGLSTFSPDYPVTTRNSVGATMPQHIRQSSFDDKAAYSKGSVVKEEAELTIEDILNSDPFEDSMTTDTISSPHTKQNYTHNEVDEDAILSSFIELENGTSPSMPLGLGLDFPLDPPKRLLHLLQVSQKSVAGVRSSPSPNTSSIPNMTPTTPVAPPQAPFHHSKSGSIDARSPKRIATSPSKSHTFNVSKKQIRKSSSFTGGMHTSPSAATAGQSSLNGVTAPFQVHLSNSGTVKQQPQFSLSDCSNSFSIISNATENFSFVMEMAPKSPSTAQTTPTILSSASNKLRRKSLSKIQPRSIEKPGLRKTQSSYFALEIEAQPQKVLKGMNDGVVIFQLNNARK